MRTTTRFLSILGAGLLTLSLTATNAHAAGKIVSTGIPAIDDVFGPASAVITDLEASQKELALARKKIRRALGAKEGADMAAAVEKFAKKAAGKISVEMVKKEIQLVDKEKIAEMKAKAEAAKAKADAAAAKAGKPAKKKKGDGKASKLLGKVKGKVKGKAGAAPTSVSIPFPQLSVAPGAPSSITSAVTAINEALDGTVNVMKTCMSIPGKLQATIAQASLLPVKAPKQIKEAGLTKEAGEEVMKGLKANVKVVASLPKEAIAAGKEVKELMAVVSGIAGGAAKAGADAAKDAAGKAKDAAKAKKK